MKKRVTYIKNKINQSMHNHGLAFIVLFITNLLYIVMFLTTLSFSGTDFGTPSMKGFSVVYMGLGYVCKLVLEIFAIVVVLQTIKNALFQKCLTWVILVFCVCLFIINSATYVCFHIPFNLSMLELVLSTNFYEAIEFIEINGAMFGTCIFCSFFALVGIVSGFNRIQRKCSWKMGNYPVIFLSFSITVLAVTSTAYPLLMRLPSTLFEQAGDILYDAHKEAGELEKVQSALQKQNIIITKNNATIPNVVFVLGEATNRNHMGIYGYQLPTTPFLQQRLNNHDLYVFRDVISSQSVTMKSMENMFTFYRTGASGEWYTYINIFDILNYAGYHTYWISNQESAGSWEYVASVYANRCDERYYTELSNRQNQHAVAFDAAILPVLKKTLPDLYEKKFYLIHLMGCHQDYVKRYPREFALFNAGDEAGNTETKKKIRAEYDNAICYNDYILESIIHEFERSNAIIIYIPDHSEDVFDVSDIAGHLPKGNFSMLEIPMIIWTSRQFKETYPLLEKRLTASLNQPFMSDDMIHVILDLLQIETPDYDPTKSVINGHYDSSRTRIYQGMTYTHGPTPGR